MPLIQKMRAVVILKMSTMPFSIAQDIHMPGSFFRTFPESHHIYQPATMQQAGQVPYLDQNVAHEQSLGQSDGSLPGLEQTLN